jgi:plastocyanin
MYPDLALKTLNGTAIRSAMTRIQVPAATWVHLLGLALLLLVHPVTATAEETDNGGVIQGTVRITEKLAEQRMRFRLYPGFHPAPPPANPDTRDDEYRNIVIYIKSDTPLAPQEPAGDQVFRMTQEGETFRPHVLPIPAGSTVEFPNLDPIFHNVFSLSAIRTFDLGRYPQGDSKSVQFDTPGLVPVFCHIHSDMSAVILVMENPYFTVPGTDRRYRIANVPPGTHTLVAWHERSEPVEHTVQVKAGETLELNLAVPIENEEIAPP